MLRIHNIGYSISSAIPWNKGIKIGKTEKFQYTNDRISYRLGKNKESMLDKIKTFESKKRK